MKKLLLFLALISTSCLMAQSAFLLRETVATELHKIEKALTIYHPNPYYWHHEAAVADFRAELLASLPDRISRADAFRCYNQFVNFFNDAHTRISAYSVYQAFQKEGGLFFPMAVDVMDQELVIRDDYGPRIDSNWKGQRILEINGVGAPQLMAQMLRHAHRETDELDRAVITRDFPYYLWLAYGWTGPYQIKLLSARGEVSQTEIDGISAQVLTQAQKSVAPPATDVVAFQMLDDSIAYLNIRDFESWSRQRFRKVFAEAFAYFAQEGATSLVVDVRNHNGGDARIGEDLARHFSETSFRPFAYSTWKATPALKGAFKNVYVPGFLHWALPVLKGVNPHTKAIYRAADYETARVEYPVVKPFRANRRFRGEVYLLMDHHTFSAGTCFAALFKDHQMGTIIGQPSGNLANFHADALLRFELPESGFRLQISNSYLVRPSGEESLKPVMPDVHLPHTVDALTYTVDQLIRRSKTEAISFRQ